MAKKNNKKKYGACARCDGHRRSDADALPTAISVPGVLNTPDEVDAYPERTPETNAIHAVELDHVLATYDFRGAEWADWQTVCCYGHPHARGYMVRTVCGLTLAIGNDCGERWIDGLKGATQHAAKAASYFGGQKAIRRAIETIPGILPTLEETKALLDFKHAFGQYLSPVAKALRADATDFYGASLWTGGAPDIVALHKRFAALKTEHGSLCLATRPHVVQKVVQKFTALDREARDARRWFDHAMAFVTKENLERVVTAFRIPGTVDEAGIITMRGGDPKRPMQLGLGVYGLRP